MKKGLNAMEKEQIEQKAEALLAEINIDSENGVDVIDAAQSLGFVVGTAGFRRQRRRIYHGESLGNRNFGCADKPADRRQPKAGLL